MLRVRSWKARLVERIRYRRLEEEARFRLEQLAAML